MTCWNSIVEINFSVHKGSHATMSKDTVVPLRPPEGQDLLTTMLREGAQRLIAESPRQFTRRTRFLRKNPSRSIRPVQITDNFNELLRRMCMRAR